MKADVTLGLLEKCPLSSRYGVAYENLSLHINYMLRLNFSFLPCLA